MYREMLLAVPVHSGKAGDFQNLHCTIIEQNGRRLQHRQKHKAGADKSKKFPLAHWTSETENHLSGRNTCLPRFFFFKNKKYPYLHIAFPNIWTSCIS